MDTFARYGVDTVVPPLDTRDGLSPSDEIRWNEGLERAGGHLLQSWKWGEFKQRQGWTVERLCDTSAAGRWMVQLMFKMRGPLTIAYAPRGPVLCGDHGRLFAEAMAAIDEACRRRRAATLIMEPSQRFRLEGTYKQHGLVRWIKPIQPTAALVVPVLDDESMLERMHHKTRYHVRLAIRQDVTVEAHRTDGESIGAFHRLLAETAERNGIQLLPISYFTDLCDAFGNDAEVLLGRRNGETVVAAVMVQFGNVANYLFAASSTKNRGQGAGALLVLKSAQWARDRGCSHVDLGNVGNEGLRTFKLGFGGEIHEYPPPMERRYRPALAWLVRRAIVARRFSG